MKTIPLIQKVMTSMPHTIGKDIPIQTAMNHMREYGVRHLPVEYGGKLVGILTDRDLKLAQSFTGAEKLVVEDVMTADPYTVTPEAALDQVVNQMAEHRYGSAVVQQTNGKVVGIFTVTDALRVLAEILHENYKTR